MTTPAHKNKTPNPHPKFIHKLTGEDFDCEVEVALDNGRGKITVPVHVTSSRKAWGRTDYLCSLLVGRGSFWCGSVTVVRLTRGVPAADLPPALPEL